MTAPAPGPRSRLVAIAAAGVLALGLAAVGTLASSVASNETTADPTNPSTAPVTASPGAATPTAPATPTPTPTPTPTATPDADPVLAAIDDPPLPVADEPETQVTRPDVDIDAALELDADELDFDADASDLVDDPPDLVAQGRGWGHGVGLSQYGARAMARRGHHHATILAHYYPETELATIDPRRPLRVGLLRASPDDDPVASITVAARRAWEDGAVFVSVDDGDDPTPLRPDEPVALRAEDGEIVVDVDGEERRGREARLDWDPQAAAGPALAFPDLTHRVPATRWGWVHVSAVGDVIRPTLVIDVERYLRGLAEVPPSWPGEALRAQAIAARTFALRAAATGLDPACACHLGPTDHDQVFRGWGHEAGAGPWLSAVADTAGQVVTRDGGLVWAYYSSSHGGRTERSVDSFAYLPADGQWPSLDDPWSLDPTAENPRAAWQSAIPQEDFVDATGLPFAAVVDVDILARTAGGSPHTLRIVGLLPSGLPAVAVWAGGDDRGAAAWLRRELGGGVLPSQQLTDLLVGD